MRGELDVNDVRSAGREVRFAGRRVDTIFAPAARETMISGYQFPIQRFTAQIDVLFEHDTFATIAILVAHGVLDCSKHLF